MTLEGVDLSKYNTTTNTWPDFFILRACYGNKPDLSFAKHYANVRRMHKPVAAYLYIVDPALGHGTIAQQVATFLDVAGQADGFAIDWEGTDHPTKAQTVDAVKRIKATGRSVGFYASESVFFNAGQDWNWIAHYGTTNWPNGAHIWQYQGSPLDRDRFRGTIEQLTELWASFHVTIRPAGTTFVRYFVKGVGVNRQIYGRQKRVTEHGFQLPCSAPILVWENGPHGAKLSKRSLVQVRKPGASYDGWWVDTKWSTP
jgi:hypothetical protein